MARIGVTKTPSKTPKEYKITKRFVDCILASIENPEPDSDDETNSKMDTRYKIMRNRDIILLGNISFSLETSQVDWKYLINRLNNMIKR